VQIDNTIIAGNRIGTSENNVYAAIAAGNVDGSSTTQKTITGVGNLVYQGTTPLNPSKSLIAFSNAPIVADPLLAALANNGGPTTMLPQTGSPAIDAANLNVCVSGATNSIDQRSLPRPSPMGGQCDIGAVEVQVAQSYASL
jgi:hypothetical protein